MKTKKQIGLDACIKAIGVLFFENHKDNAVFSCGNTENGYFCFLGISKFEKKDYVLQLTNKKDWDFYSSCYVKNGKATISECKLP